jgi:hypothetical protein
VVHSFLVCMYLHTHICMYVCMYKCIYVRMYVCMYLPLDLFVDGYGLATLGVLFTVELPKFPFLILQMKQIGKLQHT